MLAIGIADEAVSRDSASLTDVDITTYKYAIVELPPFFDLYIQLSGLTTRQAMKRYVIAFAAAYSEQ